jgi:hypothetical protein
MGDDCLVRDTSTGSAGSTIRADGSAIGADGSIGGGG